MGLFSLSFSAPYVLLAFALAPALLYLLRVSPPPPRRVAFPPLKLILDQRRDDATAARMPLWLLLLRMTLAGLIVLAMAGPAYAPGGAPTAEKSGALLLIVDDGWTAAPDWTLRVEAAQARIADAARLGAPVAIAPISQGTRPIELSDAANAANTMRALTPQPYRPARANILGALDSFLARQNNAHVIWLSDGLDGPDGRFFAEKLKNLAPSAETLLTLRPLRVLAGVENAKGAMDVKILRSSANGPSRGLLRAFDRKGAPIVQTPFDFAAALTTKVAISLPVELRNDIARLDIEDERAAGAVLLLDQGSRRRRVGLVAGAGDGLAQPLLNSAHYIRTALAPYADLREPKAGQADPIGQLLDEGVDLLILADASAASPLARKRLEQFLYDGGVLLRFAGPRLAAASDDLTPVRLRRGGRTLGGALSWDQPKKLAPFEPGEPFAGLAAPDEVAVSKQVLAEPEPGLPAKTWARLADGTPLVTADRRGAGLLVLFHVTADSSWSNLPMSGLFVDMLRKVAALSGENANKAAPNEDASTQTSAQAPVLQPLRTLDGFGALGAPAPTAKPAPASGKIAVRSIIRRGFMGGRMLLSPSTLLALTKISRRSTCPALA